MKKTLEDIKRCKVESNKNWINLKKKKRKKRKRKMKRKKD